MSLEYNSLIRLTREVSNRYRDKGDLISDKLLTDLTVFSNELEEKINNVIEENRVLRIGIVGEVKAGKSSFLNALIFNGKDVLPKAPTPMTAALTKIAYSENIRAEVEYYNEKDWEVIKELSSQYHVEYDRLKKELIQRKTDEFGSIYNRAIEVSEEEILIYVKANVSQEKQGCNELINMVEENGLMVEEYLGKVEDITNVDGIEQLVNKLNNYVGAEGRLTPIVKSTKIYLNIEALRGLEIIDTPGTNDPIVSRGMITRKYLSQCDAVFLLSYSGQFMKSQDIEFMVNSLPSEGVSKGLIVGSKIDSAVLDDCKNGGDFIKALAILTDKLKKHAADVVDRELEKNPNNKILASLKKSMPPQFIASTAYSIAHKEGKLSEEEKFLLNLLKIRFKDSNFDNSFLERLSGINRLKKVVFTELVKEKETILKGRLQDVVDGQANKLKIILENMDKELNVRLDNLNNLDKKQLEDKYDDITSKLNGSKSDINFIFNKEYIAIQKKLIELQNDVNSAQEHYKEVAVSRNERKEFSHSERHGFLWLKKKDVYENVTYNYANVNQVIDNVRGFVNSFRKALISTFDTIVDSVELRKKLKCAIIALFDFKARNFNENELLNPVEIALDRLTITKLEFSSEKYERIISDSFSNSVVEGDKIHNLVKKQNEVILQIINDVDKILKTKSSEIENKMMNEGNLFIDTIVKSMSGTLDAIKTQLNDRERFIDRYKETIKMVESDLRQI